jgi:hypothetical protein
VKHVRLVANTYGARKAERFRARFNLPRFSDYADVHDYLHTLLGALPCWPEENDVLELEESIREGRTPCPRGLHMIVL